jgi:capsular exopolysaccharide synthesis family protein
MPNYLSKRSSTPAPVVYEASNEDERARELAYVGRLLSSIRVHWRLFAAVFFGFLALVTIGTLLVPRQYTATVKMIVGSAPSTADSQQSTLPVLNALVLQSSDLSSNTVAELVQEGPVVDKVIDRLKLKDSPGDILSHLSVKPISETAILSLSVSWRNADQAAIIANAFASAFVDRERDLIRSQALAAQGYLQQAIANAQQEMQKANDNLSAFQARTQIADIASQTQALIQRLENAESQIAELREDQKQAQAQLASAQSQLRQLSSTIPGSKATDVNPTTLQLREQLANVEVQLATARERYTDKYPQVIELTQQRDQLRRAIDAQPGTVSGSVVAVPNPVYEQLAQQSATLRSQIQGDGAKIGVLEQQQKMLRPRISALPSTTAQLAFLQERAKLATDVYNALQQKYNDAVVAANSAISDVTVVQPASANNVSVSPNLRFNMLIGAAIGFILACLAVAVIEALQQRIREDRDVERVCGLPVIAHIPSMSPADAEALPWLQTVTLEAFLHLCASLRLRTRSSSSVVAITSPEKGDGKSTVAFHLASAMSRIRSRVLLVDGDMRRPAVHVQAKIKNRLGLSDVLSGVCKFEDAVAHVSPTLDILTAGSITENPVGLIESPQFDRLLELGRDRYDYVIVDTAALNPVVDSVLIAAHADATALVLSAHSSNEKVAGEASERLRALGVDNIVGVVMNRTRTKFSDYRDYFSPRSPALPHSVVTGEIK